MRLTIILLLEKWEALPYTAPMRTFLQAASLTALLLFGWTTPAQAMVIVPVNGSWVEFFFEGVGEPLPSFQIDALTPIRFTVVDGYLPGDRFAFNGLGTTSVPLSTGDDIGNDYSAALADARWSRGVFPLPPGNHVLDGTVTSSPFGFGTGAVRAETAPPASQQHSTAPEPGTWMFLGLGLAALSTQRRLTPRKQA